VKNLSNENQFFICNRWLGMSNMLEDSHSFPTVDRIAALMNRKIWKWDSYVRQKHIHT
jgi:hypothetical protein